MSIEQHPWPHTVVDSYYDDDLFNQMKSEIIAHVKQLPTVAYQTFHRSSDPGFEQRFPQTYRCANSVSPYDQLKMFNNYRPYKKLSHYVEINIIMDGYDYPIHDENPRKILSIVNYVAPEKSTGTLIYDAHKQFVKEVEWKQNRTLIFPGITGVTWHSYRVEPRKPRITLNTFLIDDMA